jgi:Ca2+-binding EF-hand superfamily protein
MGNQQTTRPFSENDVQMLVKLSGKTENEIREWYKEFHAESDQKDRMNKRQFQLFYTKLRKNPKIEQISDHIFRAFDTDNSGTCSCIYLYFNHSFSM